MRRTLLSATCAAAGLLLAAAGARGAPAPVAVAVDLSRPGTPVSPTLYGLFFEEINHAGDGGLYAELVRNRSFEDGPSPEAWSLVREGGADGAIAVDSAQPLNAAQRQSLRLEVRSPGGRVGAANTGFWGIGIRAGDEYRLSFFARGGAGFSGPLTASLESAAGEVHASAKSGPVGTGWTRQELTLRARASDPAARLVLAASTPGTVWLDMVSLFPREPERIAPATRRLTGLKWPLRRTFPPHSVTILRLAPS